VTAAAVQLDAVTVRFGAVTALDAVTAHAAAGEIVAVVGENGAGKSTLVKVLSGVIASGDHAGSVRFGGEEVRFRSPEDAAQKGAVLIPQELSLHLDLTIAENVLLGRLPRRHGFVSWRAVRAEARRHVAAVGLDVDVATRVGALPPSEQQLVAIARGLARAPRLLLLDEPTAALDAGEAELLLGVVRRLAEQGATILYVSHRLDEVLALADRVLVLRNGRLVDDTPTAGTDRRHLISAMLGGVDWSDSAVERATRRARGAPVLKARDLRVADPRTGRARPDGVDVDLYAGEIVGLVGLLGSGRTELLWSLFGALAREGTVEVDGRRLPPDPRRAVAAGIGLLTEERRATGLFPLLDVAGNVSAASLRSLSARGFLRSRREHAIAADVAARLHVKITDTHAPIGALSGGNQQKVLLGRWVARGVRILLLDEPARGIDVGAKADIYRQLRSYAEEDGCAILVTSSDVSELIGVCDRFLVLWQGRLAAELDGEGVDEARLLDLVSGDAATVRAAR
jgi:ABC-type sugar transport system ATPase subunit